MRFAFNKGFYRPDALYIDAAADIAPRLSGQPFGMRFS